MNDNVFIFIAFLRSIARFEFERAGLVALLEELIAHQASLQLVHKVTERVYYVTLTSSPVAGDLMNLQ